MALRQRLLSSALADRSSSVKVLGGTDVHKGPRDLCRNKKEVQSYIYKQCILWCKNTLLSVLGKHSCCGHWFSMKQVTADSTQLFHYSVDNNNPI